MRTRIRRMGRTWWTRRIWRIRPWSYSSMIRRTRRIRRIWQIQQMQRIWWIRILIHI